MEKWWQKYWQKEQQDSFFLARVRLTAWYLMILIGLITGFTYLTFQAKESAYVRVYSVVSTYNQEQNKLMELQDNYTEFNERFKRRVLVFDIILVLGAGLVAWWLSGRTLSPIKLMLEEQTAFVGDVSHGLRTPLTSMSLTIDAYKRKHPRISPALNELLVDFTEEVRHMSRIVEGALVLSRAKLSHVKTEEERADLGEILTRVKTAMSPLALAKKQKFLVNEIKGKVMIEGNFDQWLQVLMILIDNAIKYTPESGAINLEVQVQTGLVRLMITDDGPGITQAEHKKVFQTYYRGKQKHKVSGAGLGLAMAGKIVKNAGGTIRLTDNKPHGAKFTVTALR